MATQQVPTQPGAGATTLADVVDFAGSGREIRLRAKRAVNLGANTVATSMDIRTFLLQSMVGNDPRRSEVTQRKPDFGHARRMAHFIMQGVVDFTHGKRIARGAPIPEDCEAVRSHLGTQPYYAWAPVVASLRDPLDQIAIEQVLDEHGNVVESDLVVRLRSSQTLWIVDGQHRRIAWQTVFEYLNQLCRDRKYSKSQGLAPLSLKLVSDDALDFWQEALGYYSEVFSVTLDVHFGLTIDQERQLFHDLNNLQKTVSASLAQEFDQSNALNLFSHRLRDSEILEGAIVSDASKVNWDDQAWMNLKALNSINARLFLNRTSIAGAKPTVVEAREDGCFAFWEAVARVPGVFDREQSVAAQPALLKAIARVYHELAFGKAADERTAAQFLEALPSIDFTHGNKIWAIETLSDQDVAGWDGLEPYLPANWREKSIGGVVDGRIRFGSRHNESILVLPGILRYLAGLPAEAGARRGSERVSAGAAAVEEASGSTEASLGVELERILEKQGSPMKLAALAQQVSPGRGGPVDDAAVLAAIKKGSDRFVRTARGAYGLKSWGLDAMPAKKRTRKKRGGRR